MEPSEALWKAGRIASQVRNRVKHRVEEGMRIIEVCDNVEGWICKLGGKPAFPCNVDIDHVAAHYTSPLEDQNTVTQGTLVKVDIGVHVEGYIADTAITLSIDSQHVPLISAAEAALDSAIKVLKSGRRSSEVGAVIERTIKARGVAPIRNLTGHMVSRYIIHAGKSVPNVSSPRSHKLQAGEVYAIEPFTTLPDAEKQVADGPPGHIYQFRKKRSMKREAEKKMLRYIQTEYKTLPFASRWVLRKFPGEEGLEAFKALLRKKCLYSYPQLVEKSRKPVAQAEHTVIITEDGCEVTTA